MGESDSGWTPAFNVLYWPLRAFSRGLFEHVPALADGRVDVVPVDYVADGIVHLLDRAEAGVFNLVAGREAPTVEELITMGTEAFGIERPQLVEPGAPTKLADGEVYVPYFDMKVVFDDERARAVLEPAGIRAPRLADCFGALIDYAEAARWGKRADEPPGRARAHGARGGLGKRPPRAIANPAARAPSRPPARAAPPAGSARRRARPRGPRPRRGARSPPPAPRPSGSCSPISSRAGIGSRASVEAPAQRARRSRRGTNVRYIRWLVRVPDRRAQHRLVGARGLRRPSATGRPSPTGSRAG